MGPLNAMNPAISPNVIAIHTPYWIIIKEENLRFPFLSKSANFAISIYSSNPYCIKLLENVHSSVIFLLIAIIKRRRGYLFF